MENTSTTHRLAICYNEARNAAKAIMDTPARSKERYEAIDKAEKLENDYINMKNDLRKQHGQAIARNMIRDARDLALRL